MSKENENMKVMMKVLQIYDEENGNDGNEIQPDEDDNNCFISQQVLRGE
jgi:hypothetical protein